MGVRVLGVVGDKDGNGAATLPYLGRYEDLRSVLDGQDVDLVIVALPHTEYARVGDVLRDIGDDPVAIHLVPDVFSLASLRGGIEEFEGVPLIYLRESPLHGWNRVLKRAFDLVVGGAALLVFLPVMAVIALAIRLASPGPVLLRQVRMGLDGREFPMLKFRTMRQDAEAETGPVWTRLDDPRRTRLGGVLRRFSLDELPQLVNVLRGEMSLVGPRPERSVFVEEFRRKVGLHVAPHGQGGHDRMGPDQWLAGQHVTREADRI
jgi:lipopolysaccharide/colanic/teichoic acid biosynthesis glycosyltransferase